MRRRSQRSARTFRRFGPRKFGQVENLERRVLLASDTLPADPATANSADVDGDGQIAPLDVLTIINALSDRTPAPHLDVDGDSLVTVDDARSVFQTLNASEDAEGEPGDVEFQVGESTFVTYNSNDGSLRVESAVRVTTVEIVSASGIFTGDAALNLGGKFDIDSDIKIFKLQMDGFRDLSFGNVAVTGLSEDFLRSDLAINGSVEFPDPANPNELVTAKLSNKSVELRLQVTDLSGAPVAEVRFGDEFMLRMLVEDRRGYGLVPADRAGVFAAYMDVDWDPARARAVGGIDFSDQYGNVRSGTVRPGLIDEVGAVASDARGLDQDVIELARVIFRATADGPLTFFVNPSDISPLNDVLLFGETDAESVQDIHFVNSQTVLVVDTPEAADLVQFAKDLSASGAVFYGAGWCPHCTDQKEMFEDGQQFLPFVEVTNPDRTLNQIGLDNRISLFPTWVFADGSRLTGIQSLDTLSRRAGVSIPQSNRPFVSEVEPTVLLSGSPLHIPLDGYDPNGGPLTYIVTSDAPGLVRTTVLDDSRSMRIDVDGYGEMVYQLFDDRAPRVTEQITTLAASGFYDGVTFHRVLDDFVIQGGDPLGNGTGGSDLPDFDDQYHVDLQHNRTGILSMAKSRDDTNNSQFFIAEGPQRHLDFNHSIFGQLVEGESNRQAISETAVSGGGRPLTDVTMRTVAVFDDVENGLLMLKAAEGARGATQIHVTVRDEQGHEANHSFTVSVVPDTSNGGPFLKDIGEFTTTEGTPFEFNLRGIDVEGDSMVYSVADGPNLQLIVDPNTGLVTATPRAGFIGSATALVAVSSPTGSDTSDAFDAQTIVVNVAPPPQTGPRVIASTLVGGVAPLTRDLTIRLQFDSPLRSEVLDATDVSLTGESGGPQSAAGFSYDVSSRTLVVRYEDLPFDKFNLRLLSRNDSFAGLDGALLDGEAADNLLPSGDGAAGGDYVASFSTGNPDLDQSGAHDLLDVEVLCAVIRAGLDIPAFDYDHNGSLNADDMAVYLDRVFSSGPGDSNVDGVFDSSDLVAVFRAGEYQDDVSGNSGWADGDWNCDGEFSSGDLVAAFRTGNYAAGAQPAASDVAAALNSLFADQDTKSRARTFVA